ncbi:glycosyltransferase family 2 protein [Massilia sp. Se16.2.3]|nr:glycosyltransferase family 2 protein [Massilia sp. Se16.2.3]
MTRTTSATTSGTIRVSVVVPTCGRMDLLDRCLDALTRQTLAPGAYEVIVVDDEPNHNTLHLVAGWRARTLERGPRLVYLANAGTHGLAAAPATSAGARPRRRSSPLPATTPFPRVPGWPKRSTCSATTSTSCAAASTRPSRRRVMERLRRSRPSPRPRCARRTVSAARACSKHLTDSTSASRKPATTMPTCTSACWTSMPASYTRRRHGWYSPCCPRAGAKAWGRHGARCSTRCSTRSIHTCTVPTSARPRHGTTTSPPPPLLVTLGAFLFRHDAIAILAGLAWLGLTARLCRRRLHGHTRGATHVAEIVVTSALLPPLAVFWRLAGAIRYRVRFT